MEVVEEALLVAGLLLEFDNDLFVSEFCDTHDHVHLVVFTAFIGAGLHELQLVFVFIDLVELLLLVQEGGEPLLDDIGRDGRE